MLSVTGAVALASIASTGCQVDVGGQTLPSPYYIYDDVQYSRIAIKHYSIAKKLGVKKILQGECGHARRNDQHRPPVRKSGGRGCQPRERHSQRRSPGGRF